MQNIHLHPRVIASTEIASSVTYFFLFRQNFFSVSVKLTQITSYQMIIAKIGCSLCIKIFITADLEKTPHTKADK